MRTRSGRPKPTPVDVHAPHAGAMDATPPHIPTEIKPKALASFGSGRHTSFIGPAVGRPCGACMACMQSRMQGHSRTSLTQP